MSKKEIGSRYVTVDGLKLRINTSPDLTANSSKLVVVLFHGYSFSLDDWEKIGTFLELNRRGIPFIAVDLPKGKTTKSQKRSESQNAAYVPLLSHLFREEGIDPTKSKLIIVGPSMGGGFALSYALEKTDEILGLVLVAPSIAGINRESIENLDVPVLLIWGQADTVFPVEKDGRELKELVPQSKLLIVKGARHPVYLDKPSEFHELLFDFIEEVSS
jgi:abhydrolase domain-containing protein 14